MLFGSMVAGATSLGGGAVAFPVFTKVLEVSQLDAKVFSLAIQSVGMTSASILIFILKYPIEGKIIPWVSLGGAAGIILGAGWLAEMIDGNAIRMVFTMMLATFGLVLYTINRKPRSFRKTIEGFNAKRKFKFIAIGFFGGILTGLVGSGFDVVIFSILVLYFRLSEKICTPTSVICMAINSLIGFVYIVFFTDQFNVGVQNLWLAAVPVVVIGAPLGAFICNFIRRETVVRSLLVLICLEVVSTFLLVPMTAPVILSMVVTTLSFVLFFFWIYKTEPNYEVFYVDKFDRYD